MNLYITFGSVHAHRVNNITFDQDCVAKITAKTVKEAYDRVTEYFGPKYAFSYMDKPPKDWEKYYPRGIIDVDAGVLTTPRGVNFR